MAKLRFRCNLARWGRHSSPTLYRRLADVLNRYLRTKPAKLPRPARVRCCCAIAVFACMVCSAVADDRETQFELEIRPIFVEHCYGCHAEKKQSGSLRVDSLSALLAGGDSGAALMPGDSSKSLLIQAVRRVSELKMPPDDPLREEQISALVRWVDNGAFWPKSKSLSNEAKSGTRAETHWAFQPITEPQIPAVTDGAWVRTPVDAFVLSRLEQHGLNPSPEADRRTLARRLYFTLTGMPPSFAAIENFVHDPDPLAYERLVESLLSSPEYGRHMARHWLDIARYSDTKGYVYAREERFWVHAWTYREWIVRAFNEDLPYDRFLMLQIAADQIPDRRIEDQAAMGFLTVGRRFLGVKHDIIDDRIDVLMRGTMGLTVGCARCHDHKYDPIPTADYYSLYGVFDSCTERLVPLSDHTSYDVEFLRELKTRQEKLSKRTAESCAETSDRVRHRVEDYLKAQSELEKYPGDDFSQLFSKQDLLPSFVRQWESFLQLRAHRDDPVFAPWALYAALDPASFKQSAAKVALEISARRESLNPIVTTEFSQPCQSFNEVIQRYGLIFRSVYQRWQAALTSAAQRSEIAPGQLPDAASEQLRQVLYGLDSPCEIKDQSIVFSESFFDLATCTELWKLQGEVDRWINSAKVAAPHALMLVDLPTPAEPRIFRRGNPLQKSDSVPRQFLGFMSKSRQPFSKGSGRWELAREIIHPQNPLTARVIVNRVWTWHFGNGLVTTPSDFGLRAEVPSHPELLDWLAARFVAEGWSVKSLQRWLLLSATFRQSSTSAKPADIAHASRPMEVDPQNRLLWKMNTHRLSFEEFRDSLLSVAGQLTVADNAKPVNLLAKPFPKIRSVYGLIDRQFLPATLRIFDFANPDLHIPHRTETTVPQQALFALNHPLVLEQIGSLSQSLKTEDDSSQTINALFRQVFQRPPTSAELREALQFLANAEPVASVAESLTAGDWKYGYGQIDVQRGRTTQFIELPHFTEQGWQGGEKYPDGKLGWVRLSASGGHPGNDHEHAAIRRWTTPRDCTVRITSTIEHKPAGGDGIRAFVVSSRAGMIHSTNVHKQVRSIDFADLKVTAGETIDFVVDIGKVLNSDQFTWEIAIRDEQAETLQWNSVTDFTQPKTFVLDPLAQLAQVLLCSNEFFFVD